MRVFRMLLRNSFLQARMTDLARVALLRTLTWFETLGYAPTRTELMLAVDVERGEVSSIVDALGRMVEDGSIVERMGRIGFPERADRIIAAIRERDVYQPRKRRRARWVASWLSRMPGVRFVALANTTALGYARDDGDLDFFVVVRAGTIWVTRLFSVFPFRLFGLTPSKGKERDAVCLSYFISDDELDLSSHQLSGDDPYYRYWFLSLLPLFDDGTSKTLWKANAAVRARHPLARPWVVPPDLAVRRPFIRFPSFRWFEPIARLLQMKWFPSQIRDRMNTDTTVIVNDHALKFHVTDGREEYRKSYADACRKRGIESA